MRFKNTVSMLNRTISLNFSKNYFAKINQSKKLLKFYPFLSDTLIAITYWERKNPILL
ncbi:hypothetical protein [Brachyspira aalborgi]|uniref:hypothetical protein n=1 Tax=Brachyspira aalborgi TaxID=29522 RepID=UPI0013155C06|nr:hypothetical protein [Brachyspira aalborgi]